MTDALSESAAYGDAVRAWSSCPHGKNPIACLDCEVERKSADPRSGEDRRAAPVQEQDQVNHPSHYGKGADDPYEVIKVLRAWGFFDNALRFNSVKYLARAGKKDDIVQDLKKARWYIDEEIKDIEAHRKQKTERKTS